MHSKKKDFVHLFLCLCYMLELLHLKYEDKQVLIWV